MAAILTIGLAIAAMTSIFAVVDAVLLKPLPWSRPESLVVVHGVFPERRTNPATAPTWDRWYLSVEAWEALRSASAFEVVGAWHSDWLSNTTFGEHRDEMIPALNVSSALLPMLGVRLQRGRFFTEAEDSAFNDSILVTDEFWRRSLGAAEDIIGKRVMLGQAAVSEEQIPKTVVGVIAPGFQFDGTRPDVLRPLGESRRARASADLRIVARLATGVSLPQANALAASLVSASPIDKQNASARIVSIADEQFGSSKRPLWLLFGGAGFLLLIACSNVAALLIGEARVRRHEFAIRAAIGGSRSQLLRQLLVESGLLAVGGVALGLIAAPSLIKLIVAAAPQGMPRIEAATTDLRTALFAVTTGLGTLLVFGVAPALTAGRVSIARFLISTSHDGVGNRVTAQRFIVAAQVALALVLLTGATLFGETILNLRAQPLGFRPEGVAFISTTFTGSLYGDPAAVQAAWKVAGPNANPGQVLGPLQRTTTIVRTNSVLEKLRGLAGVTSAAATSSLPFVANPSREQVVLEDVPNPQKLDAGRQAITDGYFDAMGIRMLKGHDFNSADAAGEPTAIVSAEFERRFFPEGALNRRFRLANYASGQPYQIVGVVSDVKRQEMTDDDRPLFYSSFRQGWTPNHFVIRASGDPSLVLSAARQAVNQVSSQLVVRSTSALVERVDRSIAEERFRASLSVIFASAALTLATVGLYGLSARRVIDRRREFAVRVALGANATDVRRLVLKDAMLIVGIGFVVGLPASFAVAQISNALLFGVSATSPHIFVLTAVMLGVVVMTATIFPSRRAGRIDPVAALKE